MGRDREYGPRFLISLPLGDDEAVLARVGAEGRLEFVRDAVSAALSAGGVVRAKPDIKKAAPDVMQVGEPDIRNAVPHVRRLTPDQFVLLSHIQSGGRLPRKVAEDLGWIIGRVERRASELEALGLIRYSGGVMEAV